MTIEEKIQRLKAMRLAKKKSKGWQRSKLDAVSNVLLALREKGLSLCEMVEYLNEYHGLVVHKSTVCRYLENLQNWRMENEKK